MTRIRTIAPWFCALLACLCLLALSTSPEGSGRLQAQPPRKRTKREWKKLMNKWSRELGVKCKYCHVPKGEEFDFKADTHHKDVAAYCNENFVKNLLTKKRKRAVSCKTCHKGATHILPAKKKKKKPAKKTG